MRIEQQALVLKSVDQGESSRRVTLLTEQENLQEFVLHGFKSKKSDHKALLQTGNLIRAATEISRHKNKLINCELIEHYPTLKSDLNKITFLAKCYKIILNLAFDLQHDLKKHFLLLSKLQQTLENASVADYALLELYFCYSLTYCFDLRPDQSPLLIHNSGVLYYFNPETGVVAHGRDFAYGVLIDQATAELLVRLHQSKLTEIITQSYPKPVINKVADLLKKYFKLHINQPLSFDFKGMVDNR